MHNMCFIGYCLVYFLYIKWGAVATPRVSQEHPDLKKTKKKNFYESFLYLLCIRNTLILKIKKKI